MADIYRRLGERVRAERGRLGWTQEELAERADLHPAYVGQIERAVKKVSLRTVERLARALGLGPGELLDEGTARRGPEWESRIGGLLMDRSDSEKALIYSTLRELSRGMRRKR